MAQMTGSFGPAIRGTFLSMAILAAAALSWHAPQASAQVAQKAAKASFFPQSLEFADTAIARSSPMQEISFRNTGNGPMSLSEIVSVGGNFDLAHDCPLGPDSLAAGSNCTIKVRFAPATVGAQAGIVQVIDSARSVTQEILVQGNGVASLNKVAPSVTLVDFPTTTVYSTSGPMVVMFTNNETVNIYPYFLSYNPGEGEFSPFPGNSLIDGVGDQIPGALPKAGGPKLTSACFDLINNFMTMAPGDSCFALVYFTPYDIGVRTGSLELGWDYCGDGCGETSLSVLLRGNAVPFSDSDLTVSATEIDFGGVVVGGAAVRTLTVTSTGYGPLGFFGVRALGEAFEASSDCPRSLKTGSSCTVAIKCTPKNFALAQGDLYLDHDAGVGFTNVKLLCTGAARPVPKIDVDTTGVSFGSLSLGGTSDAQNVTISSVGTAPLSISNLSTALPFKVESGCPLSLAPGDSCVAKVTFTPSSPGRQRSDLEIGSNDPEHPSISVKLDGAGCRVFSILTARRGLSLCGP